MENTSNHFSRKSRQASVKNQGGTTASAVRKRSPAKRSAAGGSTAKKARAKKVSVKKATTAKRAGASKARKAS
jgi:hypothetical protein